MSKCKDNQERRFKIQFFMEISYMLVGMDLLSVIDEVDKFHVK